MAHLAIRGHATRGKEIIEIFKMLGGINRHDYNSADNDSLYFYIGTENNIINYDWVNSWYNDEDILIFTLEEFLEKFPYKVGDKVKNARINDLIGRITNVRWDDNENQIIYVVEWNDESTLTYFARGLQPYKEETMEEQKKYYDEWFQTDYLEFENNDDTWADEVEVNLGKDYEIQVRGDKTFIVKKKSQYPKTYEECAKELGYNQVMPTDHILGYKGTLLSFFQQLLVCRDAYWKIAGEQMGLGKPWEPDWLNAEQDKFVLYTHDNVICTHDFVFGHNVLAFPTEEMRDAFYENFKELIEFCKELL